MTGGCSWAEKGPRLARQADANCGERWGLQRLGEEMTHGGATGVWFRQEWQGCRIRCKHRLGADLAQIPAPAIPPWCLWEVSQPL